MYLLELKGNKWYKLGEQEQLSIGSSESADIKLDDPSIAPLQAKIFAEKGKWYLEAEESEEGTFVDQRELQPGQRVELHPGNQLSFGFKEFILSEYPPLKKLELSPTHQEQRGDFFALSGGMASAIAVKNLTSLFKFEKIDGALLSAMGELLKKFFEPQIVIISWGEELYIEGIDKDSPQLEKFLFDVRFQTSPTAFTTADNGEEYFAALYAPLFSSETLQGYIYLLSFKNSRWKKEQFFFLSELSNYFTSLLNLKMTLQRALEDREMLNLNLVGVAPSMQNLKMKLLYMAKRNHPVFIWGEKGVGKSRIARAIHQAGPRRDAPIMNINAPSVPKELFEIEICGIVQELENGEKKYRPGKAKLADGGSLIIEEIGEMPLKAQEILTDIIETETYSPVGSDVSEKVDVRVLATSSKSLKELLRERKISPKLAEIFQRYSLEVPSLRQRKEDIPQLFRAFLARFGEEHGLPTCVVRDEALELLQYHRWKTNIRELREIVARCFEELDPEHPVIDTELMKRVLQEHNVEREKRRENKLEAKVRELEAKMINEALMNANDDLCGAAEILGISKVALRQKMRELGIG